METREESLGEFFPSSKLDENSCSGLTLMRYVLCLGRQGQLDVRDGSYRVLNGYSAWAEGCVSSESIIDFPPELSRALNEGGNPSNPGTRAIEVVCQIRSRHAKRAFVLASLAERRADGVDFAAAWEWAQGTETEIPLVQVPVLPVVEEELVKSEVKLPKELRRLIMDEFDHQRHVFATGWPRGGGAERFVHAMEEMEAARSIGYAARVVHHYTLNGRIVVSSVLMRMLAKAAKE